MSDEEEESPKIERNSSIWKRVSWNTRNNSSSADGDERTRLLDSVDNESDAVKIDISRRDEEMGLGGQDEEDGQRESSSKTLIERQLDETQSAVHDTIGVLLRRGEDINQLRSRADGLEGAGSMFKKTARKQYREAWMDHLKKKSTVIAFYIFFTLVIILMVLGIIQMIITAIYQIRNPQQTPPHNPAPNPPPAPPPGTTGTPLPGGGGSGGGIQVTCNCYCPGNTPNPPKSLVTDSSLANDTRSSSSIEKEDSATATSQQWIPIEVA